MSTSSPTDGTAGAAAAGVLPAPRAAIYFLGFLASIQTVDPTIASTALVDAARGLDMSGGMLALAASISTLMLAATVMTAGLLGDRVGWRRMLTVALIVSIVGDLMAAAAPSSGVYLAGRAIAGVGLGGVYTAGFAYIRIVTPPKRMSIALGIFMAVASIGLVLMSFLGGVLATVNWRLAFMIVPVLCAIGLIGAYAVLPRTGKRADGPIDVTGQVLLGLGIVALLFGVSHATRGLGEPLTWGPVLAGVVLLLAFGVFEKGAANPFFPVAVLKSPLFLGALCAGFIFNFAQSATILQSSNLWQYVGDFKPSRVSAGILPFLLIGVVAALVTGKLLAGPVSNGVAILMGGAIVAVGAFATLFHSDPDNYLLLLPTLLLVGYGATTASIPYGTLVVQAASGRAVKFYGPVTSSRTTFGQFAYALGLAVSTVLVDRLTSGGTIAKLEAAGVPPTQTGAGLDALRVFQQTGKDPSTALGQQALEAAKASYVGAYNTTMIIVGVVCLAVAAAGWFLLRRSDAEARDVDGNHLVAPPAS